MNKVLIMGNVCRDIEVRYTQGSEPMAIAKFTVAVQRKTKNAQGQYDSDFISCIAFKNTAENIGKYFAKGSKIAVEGRIQTGSYKKQDGTTVYTTDVVVEGFDFCERAQNAQNAANQPTYGAPPTSYAPQGQAPSYAPQNAPQYRQNSDGTIPPQPNVGYAAPAPTAYPPEQTQAAVDAINAGFCDVPEGVDDAGLPFN